MGLLSRPEGIGATTLSILALSIMTLYNMALRIMAISKKTLGIRTFIIKVL
jgi:hypothetical protein